MLSKSKIEYLTHDWNFYPGCNHWKDPSICPVGKDCWAFGMARRFKDGEFRPHLISEKLLDPLKGKQGGRRIGVCFTGDLMGDWVNIEEHVPGHYCIEECAGTGMKLREHIFETIECRRKDTFIFLTKRPENLWKWGRFPDNAWVGVTVCNEKMLSKALVGLSYIDAGVKFLSIEPLMSWDTNELPDFVWVFKHYQINWIIIGGWSTGKTQPKIEWIQEIIDACNKANIPYFLKNNLDNIWPKRSYADGKLVQEFPKEVK